MITTANIKHLLSLLGYKEISPKRFKREFATFDYCLEVDFEAEKIIYPQDNGLKVNDDTTSNFEHPENFVVFECVIGWLIIFRQEYNFTQQTIVEY